MKPKKPTAKTKPVKAKRYWKSKDSALLYTSKVNAEYFGGLNAHTVEPVAVIPCDKASVAAMQAQIKAAWLAADDSLDMDEMTALTLAAIGIK